VTDARTLGSHHADSPIDVGDLRSDVLVHDRDSGLDVVEAQRVPEFVSPRQSSCGARAVELAVEQDCGADDVAGAPRGAPSEPNRMREGSEALKASDHDLLRPHDPNARTCRNRFVVDRGEVVEGVVGQLAQGEPKIGDKALRVVRIQQLRGGDNSRESLT